MYLFNLGCRNVPTFILFSMLSTILSLFYKKKKHENSYFKFELLLLFKSSGVGILSIVLIGFYYVFVCFIMFEMSNN